MIVFAWPDPELLYGIGLCIAALLGYFLESRRSAREESIAVRVAEELATLRASHAAWVEAFDTRLDSIEESGSDRLKGAWDMRGELSELKARHDALEHRLGKLEDAPAESEAE